MLRDIGARRLKSLVELGGQRRIALDPLVVCCNAEIGNGRITRERLPLLVDLQIKGTHARLLGE